MLVKQPFSQQPISLAYLSLLGLEETDIFSHATVLHDLQSLRRYLRTCDLFQNLTTCKADMLVHKNSRNLELLVYQVET